MKIQNINQCDHITIQLCIALYNNSISMFQIQTNFKNTAEFPQYPPFTQPFNTQPSSGRTFLVASSSLTQGTRNVDKVIFQNTSPSKLNTLTRANTQLSGLTQEVSSSRVRTTRIFGFKKLNPDLIAEKQQEKMRNLKIRNYGPIQVLSHSSPDHNYQRSPEKKLYSSPQTKKIREVAQVRFMKINNIEEIDSQVPITVHHHDDKKDGQDLNKSYTKILQTEISAIDFTILQGATSSNPIDCKKASSFYSINRILDEKPLFFYNDGHSNEEISPIRLKSNKKNPDNQLMWAWVACFLCMGIILGLLVFT